MKKNYVKPTMVAYQVSNVNVIATSGESTPSSSTEVYEQVDAHSIWD